MSERKKHYAPRDTAGIEPLNTYVTPEMKARIEKRAAELNLSISGLVKDILATAFATRAYGEEDDNS